MSSASLGPSSCTCVYRLCMHLYCSLLDVSLRCAPGPACYPATTPPHTPPWVDHMQGVWMCGGR